jgi:DNA polymerase-3 subunit alpha (Gram-positive type)
MIKNKSKDVTDKDKDLLTELHIALEMVLRGYRFRQIDIEKSQAVDFTVDEDRESLYLPFIAIDSLGETVAKSIVDARNERPFSSKKDFESRTNINKTQYAKLHTLGVFDNLSEDDTLL